MHSTVTGTDDPEKWCGFLVFFCYNIGYHRWTRASTVLSGKNAPILCQVPWPYGKYALRAFPCLTGFLLRQNCKAPASDGFSSDFWLLRCRRAGARQGEKDKKRRKDTLSGVIALVRQWYYNTFRSDLFEQAVKFFLNIPPAADPVTGCPPRSSRGPSAAGPPPSAASAPPVRPR